MTSAAHGTATTADGAELEVVGYGEGEPVAVVQTALTGDELLPFTELLAHGTGLRATHVGRRGYGISGPGEPGTTMADMAVDCRYALAALGVVPAHVVGASFSCAVALALAILAPSHVRSLTLVEPPPIEGPAAEQFRAPQPSSSPRRRREARRRRSTSSCHSSTGSRGEKPRNLIPVRSPHSSVMPRRSSPSTYLRC